MNRQTAIAVVLMVAGFAISVSATPVPTLWGVDEDRSTLFSVGDYTHLSSTTTIYGRMKWNDNGRIRDIGNDIEALTLEADGTAYMSLNSRLGKQKGPILLSFNVNQASTTGDNIATVVGKIGISAKHRKDKVTGLSIDPRSGDLYGLVRADGHKKADRLVRINKTTGGLMSMSGPMVSGRLRVDHGEDMVFDGLGNLYVTDARDDQLYRVDKRSGRILSLLDADQGRSVNFESLAWDYMNDRMIGVDTRKDNLHGMTFRTGHNPVLGDFGNLRLKDVEGMAFAQVPEPATVVLVTAGLISMAVRRRRGVSIA